MNIVGYDECLKINNRRIRILKKLNYWRTQEELVNRLDIPQPTLSKDLKKMDRFGLVDSVWTDLKKYKRTEKGKMALIKSKDKKVIVFIGAD